MIVSGLRRAPSTMRSRSCATDQRPPAPARLGASVPWKRSSAIGPLWQSRQSPTLRLATIARPRAASPGLSASGLGMASPTTVYGIAPCAPPLWARALPATDATRTAVSRPARTMSAEDLGRDGLEPARGVERFLAAEAAHRLERTVAAGAGDVGQHALVGAIDASDGDAVVGRDQAVASVDQDRIDRLAPGQQLDDGRGADLGLGVGGEGRLGHAAHDGRIADDVDAGLQGRFEGDRLDRAPAGAVGHARLLGDGAGLLRREDVCHPGPV